MSKKVPKIKKYSAPIFIECQNKEVFRSPGISTQMKWTPTPGMSCQMDQGIYHIQMHNDSSPDIWEKVEVVKVSLNSLTPDQNTGILVLGSQEIIPVMPLNKTNKHLPRIKFVIIPQSFFQYFEAHIENNKLDPQYGEYYPPDYKMTVSVKSDSVPPTWILKEE